MEIIMLKWTKEYELGIMVIDEQHKILFQLIEKLEDSVISNTELDISEIISELLEYTKYHFNTEEYMMEIAQVIDLDAHKEMHQQFKSQIQAWNEKGILKQEIPGVKAFLETWITKHILNTDRKYVTLLKDKEE
jgi:hemerythrin-like metal-binding protein